ncbi:heme-binding protein, partial [Arthrospira platensis SPKY1]|nr:heme-binding protein [Arthrospira platensis SPKY1]
VYWQDGMVMEFIMPSQYRLEDLPAPGSSNVELYRKSSVMMAAIRFGGYASDEKIKTYTEILRKKLAEAGIQHAEVFQYFGYNPPYQMINRRNEIVVEIFSY